VRCLRPRVRSVAAVDGSGSSECGTAIAQGGHSSAIGLGRRRRSSWAGRRMWRLGTQPFIAQPAPRARPRLIAEKAVRNGNKTFVHGNCQRQPRPIPAVRAPTAERPALTRSRLTQHGQMIDPCLSGCRTQPQHVVRGHRPSLEVKHLFVRQTLLCYIAMNNAVSRLINRA